jgi:hypothetical protein
MEVQRNTGALDQGRIKPLADGCAGFSTKLRTTKLRSKVTIPHWLGLGTR